MSDLVSGLLFTLLSGAVFAWSLALPASRSGMTGPGFLPRVLATIGVIIGLLLCIRAFRHLKARTSTPRESSSGTAWTYYLRLLGLVAVATVYVFTLKPLGYLFASVGFLLLTLLLLHERRILMLLALPIGLTAAVYFLFNELLSLRLPAGNLF